MEHRDKSNSEAQLKRRKGVPQVTPQSQHPAADGAVDLFAIDLSTELPNANNDQFTGLPDFASVSSAASANDPFGASDDPFASTEPLADGVDPFALTVAEPPNSLAKVQPRSTPALSPGVTPIQPVGTTSVPSLPPAAGALPTDRSAVETLQTDATVHGVTAAPAELSIEQVRRRKFFWTAAPSWAISLAVHVAVLFVLAAVSLEEVQNVISVLQASSGEPSAELDSFDLQGPTSPMELAAADEPISPPTVNPVVSLPEMTEPEMTSISTSFSEMALNSMSEHVLPSAMLSSTMSTMKSSLNSRSVAAKSEMLERFGGNAASEKSVAMALKWIAEHQAPNGSWSFAHSQFCRGQCKEDGTKFKAVNGATAMALLPFLGAGQTHLQGQYKATIKKGLAFLITNMKVTPGELPTGSWSEPDGTMYSHGLAAITICEAYAMTRDPDLLQPAQLAINFLVYAQDERGGGWRYGPKQPGDTSVVGWCLMALKSGSMGNLVVPAATFRGASGFLDFVSTNNGAYYGYDKPTSNIEGRQATIAVGLLCRMYLGWPKDHEALKVGVAFLDKRGPSTSDLYFSYYATQVMRHHGGPEWEKWNAKMRDSLIKEQVTEGHAAGSWYAPGGHGKEGGRLYATSLATMILEVYYRHMPLYSDKSSDDSFEL